LRSSASEVVRWSDRIGATFRTSKTALTGYGRGWKEVEDAIESASGDARKARNNFDALTLKISQVGDATSRAFGKGSRNDFINFSGSLIGAFVKLPALFTRVASGVEEFIGKIRAGEVGFG